MDTKKLKQKILDLAVRGKLVPQDPSDEPASVLLERIRTEKEQLIKEKKIKRDKNESHIYRSGKSYYEKRGSETVCIDDEIPFEIPASWEWTRLGTICKMKAGTFIPAADISKDNKDNLYKCYGGNGVRGYVSTFSHCGENPIIGRQGALCGNVNWACGEYYATEHAVVCTPYADINKRWLYYILKALNLNQYSTGAAQPGLAVQTIEKVLIAVPPIIEQYKLANIIESANNSLELLDLDCLSLKAIIKQTKAKVLDLAIRGKLVAQDPTDEPASILLERIKAEKNATTKPSKRGAKTATATSDNSHYPNDIPQSWMYVNLVDVVNIINGDRGVNYPAKNKLSRIGDIPFISAANIDNGVLLDDNILYLSENQFSKLSSGKLQFNDIALCIRGSLGKFCYYHLDTGAIASSLVILRFGENMNVQYIGNYISSSIFADELLQYNNGTAQPNLSSKDLCRFKFPLPPLNEQNRIVEKVDEIFKQLDNIEKALME